MKCIYCAGKTSVVNSRPTKTPNGTWRRRQCDTCDAIFTTRETADLAAGIIFAATSDQLEPFDRDHLFISIYQSCKHRPDAASSAGPITDTVIMTLLTSTDAPSVIQRENLMHTTHQTLLRFDSYAAQHYQAYVINKARKP